METALYNRIVEDSRDDTRRSILEIVQDPTLSDEEKIRRVWPRALAWQEEMTELEETHSEGERITREAVERARNEAIRELGAAQDARRIERERHKLGIEERDRLRLENKTHDREQELIEKIRRVQGMADAIMRVGSQGLQEEVERQRVGQERIAEEWKLAEQERIAREQRHEASRQEKARKLLALRINAERKAEEDRLENVAEKLEAERVQSQRIYATNG